MEHTQLRINRRRALQAVTALAAAPFSSRAAETLPRDRSMDDDWRFHRGDAAGAEAPGYNDAKWRVVQLPHDWSIEDLPARPETSGEGAVWADCNCPDRVGPFDRDLSVGKGSTGWVVGGTGWYRKSFAMAAVGKRVELRFDGVYMDSDVWINGHALGNHPYGYTGFAYDITPHLGRDGQNVVAVRVRNEGKNSRWYSGSGIYRHVWLTVTEAVRVPLWGVYVTTPEVTAERATVKVSVRIENRGEAPREVKVRVRLRGVGGVEAGQWEATQAVEAGSESDVAREVAVAGPRLWSVESPALYVAEVELSSDGKTLDRTGARFGIRKIEVDAERGLRVNGVPVKLKGGCLHHDNGVLGAAAIDRAEERRVELMKANGYNAIRCSHNPPSPAFLDACDRLGVMVIDEAFDMWEKEKNPQDYHLFFKEWWERDIDAMVRRDRNHPSVVIWSIGNEIPERADPAGVALARQLGGRVRELDPTRPVTAALPFFWESGGKRPWSDSDAAFDQLDVCGYNYQWPEYESDHARKPRRVMMGTESFPLHAWENWRQVEKHAYVLGDFVWTGMDYLGEASIGNARLSAPVSPFGPPPAAGPAIVGAAFPEGAVFSMAEYPWFNAYCGDIDLIGGKKPQSYYRDVLWGRSKLEMAVERPVPEGRKEQMSAWGWSDELRSWTWPGREGQPLKVRVYSTGDQVRLLLNGKEVGVQAVSDGTKLKAEFTVAYERGELKAVAVAGGKEVAELSFQTTGAPAALRLRADRREMRRGRGDLSYVTAEVVDARGNLVADATEMVTFTIAGAGALAAVGSANPKEMASFQQPRRRTYQGRCLAVVRPAGTAGTVTLRADAAGLKGAVVSLRVG